MIAVCRVEALLSEAPRGGAGIEIGATSMTAILGTKPLVEGLVLKYP